VTVVTWFDGNGEVILPLITHVPIIDKVYWAEPIILDETGEGVVGAAVEFYLFLEHSVIDDVVDLGGDKGDPVVEAAFADLHHRVSGV